MTGKENGEMIEFKKDGLLFSFPEVHPEAKCSIVFQRTLRVPRDGGRYPVPPGLGRFPLERIDSYSGAVPDSWERSGVFLPMYQSEALLVIFIGWYPFALRVTVGGMNAITGRRVRDERLWRPQDYVVFPKRPWMEWFCVGNGRARQFLAMPLQENQVLPKAQNHLKEEGGIAITAHPMRAESYRKYRARRTAAMSGWGGEASLWGASFPEHEFLGISEEREDSFGAGAWETAAESRCSVYPVNSLDFLRITGSVPLGKPPTREEYSEAGLPWYGEYGNDAAALERMAPA
jgi:hypothetical protein